MPHEGFQNLVGQRLEERIGHREFAFCDSDARLANGLFVKQSEFRHGLIAVAKHQCFAGRQFGQVARQIRFCVVDIDLLHNYIVNQKLN